MPQFDKITFFTQIFWLFIIFFSFYVVTLRVFIPEIAAVLKTRKKKLAISTTGDVVSPFKNELDNVEKNTNSLLEVSSEVLNGKIINVLS